MNQERFSIESKIKKIDEQIAMLSKLKSQYAEKLNGLGSKKFIAPKPANNNQLLVDHAFLLKDYFRGREDVYAKLWINNRTGKRGYSPVCKNEWVRTLCRKPAIKCSECPNQQFLPFDEVAIRQHLEGRQVVGVYPMLKNEACQFLAIDFDRENWLDDIRAIMATCRQEGIPAAVERSRSGSGGHLWIFFSEEVPAILARKLGSSLITKTMARRYQIDMKSYDRIFPNQDTMPKGGYGNLIALPFQKEAMRRSNSVFIDDNGVPYPDQWTFLSSLGKMSFRDVEALVDEASKTGQIIAVRQSPVEESDEPWMRLPSGKRRFKVDINELPQALDAVLANRLYIKIEKGPSVLFNQLKHLAAFQNPEFYRKQKMRFSTHATPRVICCAEIIDGYLSLPRGCLDDVMVQSMDLADGVDDRIMDYGFVIVDECHHVGAVSFEKVLAQVKAKYVLGLTATPYRRDGHQPIIHMQCGPICHQIKRKDILSHIASSQVILRSTEFEYPWSDNSRISDVWSELLKDSKRNDMIIDDVLDVLDEGRFPLILTERREHLQILKERLRDKIDFLAVLYGGMGRKSQKEIFERIKESVANSRSAILATGSYIGEGFDEPRLDTLFLTMPSSFKGRIVQYAGRLHRYHHTKHDIRIYDYVDARLLVLERMFKRRIKTYKMLGYQIL